MRLLCVSDIHGKTANVAELLKYEESAEIDVIIVCGDITQLGGYEEAETIMRLFRGWEKPVFAVHGNMDTPPVLQYLVDERLSIHRKQSFYKNVRFEGLGGGNTSPFNTPIEYNEDEISHILKSSFPQSEKKSPIVFVSHTPPGNTHLDTIKSGIHVGSIAIREFIVTHKPDLFLCGHIHESMGIDTVGGCTAVNLGPFIDGNYAIIDLDETTGASVIHRKMLNQTLGR